MGEWMDGPPWVPVDVTDVLVAFPGDVRHLMPPMGVIPDEFHGYGYGHWSQFQREWFAYGLADDAEFYGQPGIDPEKAFRHLSCVQGSFQPKHEHKVAAVAWLASLWFTDESHWRIPERGEA